MIMVKWAPNSLRLAWAAAFGPRLIISRRTCHSCFAFSSFEGLTVLQPGRISRSASFSHATCSYTILGVPYYSYSIMHPQALFFLIISDLILAMLRSQSCNLSAAARILGTSRQLVQMRPPGGGASAEKVSTFRSHLHRTLEKGERVELSAWGAPASQNTIQAFATCSKAVQFQVRWQQKESEKERCLHFIAKCFLPWEEYLQNRIMNTKSILVQAETRPLDLARSIASVLHKDTSAESRAVRVYAPLSDEAAVHVLAKGLASASSLHPFKSLNSVCNIVTPMDDPTSRLFAYLTFADQEAAPEIGAGVKVFHAYPPANADQETARRFIATVQDRLQMGNEVKMNCRGPDAVMHAIQSFCLLKGHVAEFRVAWASADTPDKNLQVVCRASFASGSGSRS